MIRRASSAKRLVEYLRQESAMKCHAISEIALKKCIQLYRFPLNCHDCDLSKGDVLVSLTGDVRVASLIHHTWVPSKAELGTTWAQDIPGNIPGPPSTKPRSVHVLPNQHRVTLARCSAERRCPDSCDVTACRPKTAPSLTHFAARDRPDFTVPL